MSDVEYRRATAAQGGLLIVKGVDRVAFGDRVRIRDHLGRKRNGQVILAAEEEALIQVFEGTDNLDLRQHLGPFPRPAAHADRQPGPARAGIQRHR